MAERDRRPAAVQPQTASGATKRQRQTFRGRPVPKGTNITMKDLEGLGRITPQMRKAVESGNVSPQMATMIRRRMFNLQQRDKKQAATAKRKGSK